MKRERERERYMKRERESERDSFVFNFSAVKMLAQRPTDIFVVAEVLL